MPFVTSPPALTLVYQLSQLDVVKLIDIVKKEKCVYLVMEHCAGGDIGEFLRTRGGKLPPTLVQQLMTQLASALQALYKANLVHRDLKPQNLLLTKDLDDNNAEENILNVADFGFARFMQPSDLAETLCGSPLYMVQPRNNLRHPKS